MRPPTGPPTAAAHSITPHLLWSSDLPTASAAWATTGPDRSQEIRAPLQRRRCRAAAATSWSATPSRVSPMLLLVQGERAGCLEGDPRMTPLDLLPLLTVDTTSMASTIYSYGAPQAGQAAQDSGVDTALHGCAHQTPHRIRLNLCFPAFHLQPARPLDAAPCAAWPCPPSSSAGGPAPRYALARPRMAASAGYHEEQPRAAGAQVHSKRQIAAAAVVAAFRAT